MEARMVLLYSLICSLFSLAAGFSVTFTDSPTQCSSFTVNWKADSGGGQLGPPFVLLVIPVNGPQASSADATGLGTSALSPPIRREIQDSAFSNATKTGNFTIDQLALKAGEHFVVVMDDGFGYATGGVSSIHTVASTSGSSSCLSGSSASLVLSTQSPAQCGNLNIVTPPPADIRGFVPGGAAFSLDLGTGSSGDVTTSWTVNRPSGSNLVLMYRGKDGSLASSGLLGIASGTTSSCLGSGSQSLTATGTMPSTVTTPESATQTQTHGGNKIKVPAIVGGIIGGLAFVGLVALVTFYCVMRRTDGIGRPKSRGTVSPYVSAVSRDPTVTSGAGSNNHYESGGSGRIPNENTKSKRKTDLEAGFMSGIFGGGSVKKKAGGYRRGNDREISSKKRREMYPGLSIASTQNRSIGLTTLDDDPPLPRRTSLDDMPPPHNNTTAMTTPYRDVKRSDARPAATGNGGRPVSLESSAMMSTPSTVPPYQARLDGITESSGYGSGTGTSSASPVGNRREMGENSPFPRSATATSPTALNSGSPISKSKKTERPSTAPTTEVYSPSGFHRPTRRAGEEGYQEELDGRDDGGVHEYPPDRKDDEPRRTSVTDDEIPRVRVDLLSSEDDVNDGDGRYRRNERERDGRSEKQRQEEASVRRVLAQSSHPYALAQSPHLDDDESHERRTFTNSSTRRQQHPQLASPSSYTRSADGHSTSMTTSGTGPNPTTETRSRGWSSVSHPYSNPSAVSHSDDGHRYGGGGDASSATNSRTQIIRHRDAGRMMGSEDGDEAEEESGRRILELPPSYGEVTASGRRRDR